MLHPRSHGPHAGITTHIAQSVVIPSHKFFQLSLSKEQALKFQRLISATSSRRSRNHWKNTSIDTTERCHQQLLVWNCTVEEEAESGKEHKDLPSKNIMPTKHVLNIDSSWQKTTCTPHSLLSTAEGRISYTMPWIYRVKKRVDNAITFDKQHSTGRGNSSLSYKPGICRCNPHMWRMIYTWLTQGVEKPSAHPQSCLAQAN